MPQQLNKLDDHFIALICHRVRTIMITNFWGDLHSRNVKIVRIYTDKSVTKGTSPLPYLCDSRHSNDSLLMVMPTHVK